MGGVGESSLQENVLYGVVLYSFTTNDREKEAKKPDLRIQLGSAVLVFNVKLKSINETRDPVGGQNRHSPKQYKEVQDDEGYCVYEYRNASVFSILRF